MVTPRFAVVKLQVDGEVVDIRLVWDCKKNGLNETLYAPRFMLATFADAEDMVVKWLDRPVGDYLAAGSPVLNYKVEEGQRGQFVASYHFDVDVGQHFNNFRVHEKDRHLLGVRVTETRNDGSPEKDSFMRFNVLNFGLKCAPEQACQGQARILEICRGDRRDENNPFQWERVLLNLPCCEEFDPAFPRVMPIRRDNELATRETSYVDDIRGAGRGEKNARDGARYLKSRMNSLGNQADDRKYRPPSTAPGAWTGTLLHTSGPFPVKSTTAKKWNRFRDGCKWVLGRAGRGGFAETAELRRIAGLGVHLSEVYPDTRCFLKGFFNAMEAFREGRDLDGWRLDAVMHAAKQLEIEDAGTAAAAEGYPALTRVTNELSMHVNALLKLYPTETPETVPIRPTDKHKLRYAVADASAEGFGAGTQYPGGEIKGRDGLFLADFAKGGSNVREAQNICNHLLIEIKEGQHSGYALWFFTDNSVWVAVWLKGMSSAKHLFSLVVELKLACREHEVHLCLCHISGDRMIETGMDGWSRGNQDCGILLGHDLRELVPLNRGPFESNGSTLEAWCAGWMGDDYSTPLTPEGWFWEGHQPGIHVWAPPPAAALVALKELAKARQKRREHITHVFICQRILWQEEWRSRFEKEMDVWFMLHPGTVWTNDAFEPLLVGISFPSYRSYPWLLRQEREKVVEIGRALSKMSKTCHLQVRDYLRELWSDPRALPAVP